MAPAAPISTGTGTIRSTFAITSCCAPRRRATTSTTTAWTNRSKISRFSAAINDNYLNVQQDILETFVDRGQLRKLTEPTIMPTGKRIPGLKLDHPRQLAVMHALVRFAPIAGGNTFTTAELYSRVLAVLGCPAERYTLASLRYDLAKLRAKGLVAKLPNSRRYQPINSCRTATQSAWSS